MVSENTILVRFWGGLGNQMYQYALARNLSILNNNAQILFNKDYFRDNYRDFELDKLNIKGHEASPDTVFDFDNGSMFKPLGRLIEKIPWIRVKDAIRRPFNNVFTENGMKFNPDVLKLRGNVYLKGYWASYKYFRDIRDVLVEDFEFKSEMNDKNKAMADKIISTDCSVALHVRRGDYISLKGARAVFCSPYEDGYYNRAIFEVENKFENPFFFLFSDDPEWVRQNIKVNHQSVVVNINSGSDSYWDMKLMSLCKHNIISNSTFSWWGAWLNQYPEKHVIAPRKWMNIKDFKLEDTIPEDWLIL